MMGMPGGQRRILVKTEDAIRAADPGLASLLDTFGWLSRDEEMPQTEQLPAGGRLHLGLLPRTLAADRESGARPVTRYAAIVFFALVVAFWVSSIVIASASAHSASCPSGKMVTAPRPGTTIATCRLSGEAQRGHNGDDLGGDGTRGAQAAGHDQDGDRDERRARRQRRESCLVVCLGG
jgi:hypothetical protein